MKYCPQCNLEFPDHFQFCGSCGEALTSFVVCPSCGELTDRKWPYCTYCGTKLSTNKSDLSTAPEASRTPPVRSARLTTIPAPEQSSNRVRPRVEGSQEWYSAADLYDEETMTEAPQAEPRASIPQLRATDSVNESRSAPSLTMLSAYGEPETPSEFRWWHGVILGLFLLAFVSVLGIGAWYWWSPSRSVTETSQPIKPSPGSEAENPSSVTSQQPKSSITSETVTDAISADEEIKRIHERRIGAKPSEGVAIISVLEQGEKKYPTDYRFPYELSKLSIKGFTSHHEAFEPLARAAQKAIDNGQADEMLNGLMTDKDGDFYKLSHGHREWKALEEALRNRDKGLLKASIH